MQASLTIIATIAGISEALIGGFWLWYVGASLMFFVVPSTFIAIVPTNKQLLDSDQDRSSPETEAFLQKWGKLHAIRSLTSTIATVLYVYPGVAS